MPMGHMKLVRKGRLQSGKSTRKIAKKALRLAKAYEPEIQVLDTVIRSAAAVTDLWSVNRVSCPAQGDNDQQRDGNEIKNVSVEVYGDLKANSSSTQSKVRIVAILDKQNNGIAPIVLDVFELNEINSFPSSLSDNAHRFKFLFDKTYTLAFGTETTIRQFHLKAKVSSKQMFAGTTNADASCGKNSIWVLIIGNEVTNDPTANLDCRYHYRDI